MILPSKLSLALCTLFTLATLILIVVSTSGSTSNYNPLNKIYIGEVDISHIRVDKLLPKASPMVAVLAAAMKAPNASYAQIFAALKAISTTEALDPLMGVLTPSNNVSETLGALTVLAPAAINGTNSSTAELNAIYNLVADSKDTNTTLKSLSSFVALASDLQKQNATVVMQMQQQLQQAFGLLEGSKNVSATVASLSSLNSMKQEEKQQLTPVFALFADSRNLNGTLSAVSTFMTTAVSGEQAQQLFGALSKSDNVPQTLQQLQQAASNEEKVIIGALATLLNSSSDATKDLTILQSLLQNNVTSSQSAKEAFSDLTTLIASSNDTATTLTTVATMANTTSETTTKSLTILEEMLNASKNQTNVMLTIGGLQSTLSKSDASKQKQVEALFALLNSSSNPTETFKALNELTAIAQSKPAVFTPILDLLREATASNQVITLADINEIMPDIISNLNIASHFRLGIFTYCRVNNDKKVLSCTSPKAVQGLDMKQILYDELEHSDFRPYLQALNIHREDLVLVGKLPDKEHQYKPAIRAILALNLLAIILSFFLLISIVLTFFNKLTGRVSRWVPSGLALFVVIFSLLGAIISVVVTEIIKEGTAKDHYNVVHKGGSSYYGMVWTAFVLSLITAVLLLLSRSPRRDQNTLGQVEEETSSSVVPSDKLESETSPEKKQTDIERDVVAEDE